MTSVTDATLLALQRLTGAELPKPDAGRLRRLEMSEDVAVADRSSRRSQVAEKIKSVQPQGKHEKRALRNMAAILDRELAIDQAQGYVAGEVAKTGNDMLKAAFLTITHAHPDLKSALVALKDAGKGELVKNGLAPHTLRGFIREHYKPSAQTLKAAGLSGEQIVMLGGGADLNEGND